MDNVQPDAKAGDGNDLPVKITAVKYIDRTLGQNDRTESVRNMTHFIMTGSKIQLAGDGWHTRLNYVYFDRALTGRDEYPPSWIVSHHPERVRDALTILLAYQAAGSPKQDLLPWRFPEWDDVVRSALVWLGMADPRLTSKDLQPSDAEGYEALVHALHAQFKAEPFQAQAVLDHVTPAMTRALKECGRERSDLDARKVGLLLRDVSGSWFGQLRLMKAAQQSGGKYWRVEVEVKP